MPLFLSFFRPFSTNYGGCGFFFFVIYTRFTHIFGGHGSARPTRRCRAWTAAVYGSIILSPRTIRRGVSWYLYCGSSIPRVCCIVPGLLPAYQADRFKQVFFAELYIAVCGPPKSKTLNMLLQYTYSEFTLRDLKFNVLSSATPRGFGVIGQNGVYVNILVIPVRSRRHCGPQSNLNFVKHILDTHVLLL